MPEEIERKFVVPIDHHHLFVDRPGGTEIFQAYLSTSPDATVRVRTMAGPEALVATLTVKGRSSKGGVVRPEWEWSLPTQDVQDIVERLQLPVFRKVRHTMTFDTPGRSDRWEIDVLRVNTVAGRPPAMWRYLVLAEYEAPTVEQARDVPLPPWVGLDVTDDPMFAMSALTTVPQRDLAWRRAYPGCP